METWLTGPVKGGWGRYLVSTLYGTSDFSVWSENARKNLLFLAFEGILHILSGLKLCEDHARRS